jgi:predicted secreted protein
MAADIPLRILGPVEGFAMDKRRASFVMALTLIGVVFGTACWNGESAPARTACDVARRQFCDPTRAIEVNAGQRFTIIFRANSSIGDQWRLDEPVDTTVLRAEGTDFVSDNPKATGSGHTQIWSFTALAPGTAHIRLGNHYRFGPVTATREYTITVRPS